MKKLFFDYMHKYALRKKMNMFMKKVFENFCIIHIQTKNNKNMNTNKLITYGELYNLYHIIEFQVNDLESEGTIIYNNTKWKENSNINMTYAIFFLIPNNISGALYGNYNSTPIYTYGTNSNGKAHIMIYNDLKNELVKAKVQYVYNWSAYLIITELLMESDNNYINAQPSRYYAAGWLFGNEV